MDLRLPIAAVAALAALPVLAMTCRAESGERVVPLVELYTSEGCSSCPPADRWLATAFPPGSRGDVVALAFHVDYWDRLGWRDRFASAAASERQALAARSNAASFVYTPQVLLQGRDFRGWRRGEVHAALAAAARPAAAKITVDARVSAGSVDAEVSVGALSAESRVLVALVDSGHASDVKAGENRGRRLRHDHVVRAFASRAVLGAETFGVSLPRNAPAGSHPMLVALVQDALRGDVLQTVALDLQGCDR